MQVALLSYNARPADAIGNSVADKLAFFQERGAVVRVFLEDVQAIHPQVASAATNLTQAATNSTAWDFLTSCDLVLAEYPHDYALLDYLPLLAGGKPRLLVDYHGVTPPELWTEHQRDLLERGVARRGLLWCADRVLVHSRCMAQELERELGLPAERLAQMGFPIDSGTPLAPPLGQEFRRSLGLEQAHVLLFVGRLAPNKNVPLLVQALNYLRDLQSPVHLVIVGDDRDLYAEQARLCRQRAEALGVSRRVHLLGPLVGERLRQAYAAADVFVTASLWESFCLPVVEALAAGVPVVASRSFALPETLGCAGLTFEPGDAKGLARQVRRVLESKEQAGEPAALAAGLGFHPAANAAGSPATRQSRIAVVAPRHGAQYVCGITRSLRSIVTALVKAHHQVEVFTTCALTESDWRNDLHPGTIFSDGAPVHLFPIDSWDRQAYLRALGIILHSTGPVSAATEQAFLTNGLHSGALIDTLRERADEFDAILVGPYLSSLSVAAARVCPGKTLLIPCLHDEPLARLNCWRAAYGSVGGLLLHSAEEGGLAAELGLGHPHAPVIGSLVPNTDFYSRETLEARLGSEPRYVAYCGRFSAEKNLPQLFDWIRRYSAENPGRFTFVFTGQGEVGIPEEPWAKNLGFVPEYRKREVMARADALVTLSENESLSLAALEAWSLATPVIASAGCRVLAGHIERSRGGRGVRGYHDFAAALNELWEQPERWGSLGRSGQTYVRACYYDSAAFTERLERASAGLAMPLHIHMIWSGLKRACDFSPGLWRDRLGVIVDELLAAEPRAVREEVEIRRRAATLRVPADLGSTLAAVRIRNRGTLPLLADGPARTVLTVEVHERKGGLVAGPLVVSLPKLILPGEAASAAVAVPLPRRPGTYRLVIRAGRCGASPDEERAATLRLVVLDPNETQADSCCAGLLDAVQHDLADADRLQHLPDDYLDVSTGALQKIKLLLKQKLLGNFKTAYVDVLSRQQSAFNRQVVSVLQHLLECVAALDHALRQKTNHRGTETQRRQKTEKTSRE